MFVKKYYNFSKHNRSDMKLYRTWYDMKRGWDVEKALTTPVGEGGRQ
jgi:hypothetical protein